MSVTIVIPTKNAEAYAQETLDSIFDQEVDFDFEVLVIDSGSKDLTIEILSSYTIRVISIPPESFNHGESRNLGAREAAPESEYIVFLSQDAKPHNQQWLQNLINPFLEDPDVAGVFSRHIPRPNAAASVVRQLTTMIQSGGEHRLVKKMPATLEEYEANKFYLNFFSNTSSAIRRSVWEKIPFDQVDFAEDAVWADKIIREGYSIVFEPSSIIMHSHNYNIIEQFRQNVDHSHAMNKLFQPWFYRSKRMWLKQFTAIPLQVCKDCMFVMHNPFFSDSHLWYKAYMMLFSLPWQMATVTGAWVGANIERMPKWLALMLSRQERIRSQ